MLKLTRTNGKTIFVNAVFVVSVGHAPVGKAELPEDTKTPCCIVYIQGIGSVPVCGAVDEITAAVEVALAD